MCLNQSSHQPHKRLPQKAVRARGTAIKPCLLGVKAAFHFGAEAAFDLDGPHPSVGPGQQQVDFRSTAAAVKVRLHHGGCAANILDNETFPTGTQGHVRYLAVLNRHEKQAVHQPAVSLLDLGGLDPAAADQHPCISGVSFHDLQG
jgi:hypothetical protein